MDTIGKIIIHKMMVTLLCLCIYCFHFNSLAQQNANSEKSNWSNTGMEVQNTKQLPLWIIEIDSMGKNIGLSDERIRTKCEFKLRQMRIEPIEFKVMQPYNVMVSVTVKKSTFLIEISFLRRIKYEVGDKIYEMYAPTWSTNGFGTHGYDSNYILSALEEKLEEFLNAFWKANS